MDIRLYLFFTSGVSLGSWDSVGMFEREVAVYRMLEQRGFSIGFVTYGGSSELEFSHRLPGVTLLSNRWSVPLRLYKAMIPFLHRASLEKADLIKSNQTKGADVALQAARKFNKPFIARCGYMWSDLASSKNPLPRQEVTLARKTECKIFNGSTKIIVTTPYMKNYVVKEYGIDSDKLSVVPNYVLTDQFRPNGANNHGDRICFVGRLSEEKNPLAIIKACGTLDVELVVIGDGPMKNAIIDQAQISKTNVKLISSVPHLKLPDFLRSCSIFLLVSPHEGHPKTLLEAMSCGLPVIGADSPGIRDLIQHGETGWLCGTDPASIREAILHLMADSELRQRIGRNARQYVVDNFSLERIVELELEVLREVVGK